MTGEEREGGESVIPAQAGIHSQSPQMDPRLRGGDDEKVGGTKRAGGTPRSSPIAHCLLPIARSSERRVLKNSLFLILQPLSLNLVSLLVAGYITRSLGQERFGRFALAFAYADLALYLTSLGLSSVSIRDISRDHEAAPLYNARISALRLLVALLLAMALSGVGLFGGLSFEAKAVAVLAACTVPLRAWGRTLGDSFAAFEEQHLSARYEMAGGLALTAASVAALWLSPGMLPLALAYLFGASVSLMLLYRGLSSRHFRPRLVWDKGFLARKLKEGLPFLWTGMLTAFMYRVDSIILAALFGPAVAGVYVAVSYQVVQKLRVIPEAFASAAYPALAKAKDGRERALQLGRSLRYSLATTLPVGVGACFVSDDLAALLFGEPFRSGGAILAVLAWSVPLWGIIQLSGTTLASEGREKEALYRRAVSAFVFLVLTLLLAPSWAGLGSGIAFTGALFVEAIYLLASLGPSGRGLLRELGLGRILGANALLFLVLFSAPGLPVLLRILLGVLSYAAGAAALGVAPRRELRALFAS